MSGTRQRRGNAHRILLKRKVDHVAELLRQEAKDEVHAGADVAGAGRIVGEQSRSTAAEDGLEVHVLGKGEVAVGALDVQELGDPLLLVMHVRSDLGEGTLEGLQRNLEWPQSRA